MKFEASLNPEFVYSKELSVVSDGAQREGEVVHSALDVNSSFESDNELLNWIHDTYLNTQLANLHTGIFARVLFERGEGQLAADAREISGKWKERVDKRD